MKTTLRGAAMIAAAQLALGSAVLHASEVSHFPGSYFDSSGRPQLQARVLQSWPGPATLVEQWRSAALESPQRLAILLGAPVHHDPSLLPLYREAIQSETPRVRQAAAYGYHDLIGDRLPDVKSGVSGREAVRLAAEGRGGLQVMMDEGYHRTGLRREARGLGKKLALQVFQQRRFAACQVVKGHWFIQDGPIAGFLQVGCRRQHQPQGVIAEIAAPPAELRVEKKGAAFLCRYRCPGSEYRFRVVQKGRHQAGNAAVL